MTRQKILCKQNTTQEYGTKWLDNYHVCCISTELEIYYYYYESDCAATPSIGTVGKPADELSKDDIFDAPVVVVEGIVEEKCVFDYFKMRCATHDFVIKRIKVTRQKWGGIKKAKKFGYTSVKVEKTVCTGRSLSDKNFET